MTSMRRTAAVVAALAALGARPATPATEKPGAAAGRPAQRLEREGVTIELRVDAADGAAVPRAGRDADVTLTLRDAAGTPVRNLRPALWIDARRAAPAGAPVSCSDKVRAFLQGSLSARPTVDVNSYYLVTLNREPNLSVIDPLVEFGGSRLLALVGLDAPGEDWAFSDDGNRLFVSQPLAERVALVETAEWKMVARVPAGPRPSRLLLQKDGRTLWVTNEPEGARAAQGGVSVLDTRDGSLRATLVTGPGPHTLAFGRDERVVYVTNREAGTLSLVDADRLVKLRDLPLGGSPVSVAWSTLSGAAYVADEKDGTLTVIDGDTHELRTRLVSKPGLVQVRFSPDGRWGFLLNPRENLVEVIDSSSDRVVHRLKVEGGPDFVDFSRTSAYFHTRGDEHVALVSLQALGGSETPGVFRFPAGERPAADGGPPALAAPVAATPEGDAVVVANASDETVYYYKEGMAVPMGHYQNYRRQPRGVAVVDRSLRERAPGVYAARVTLPAAGRYDVALLLDAPRVVHCFDLEVEPPAAGVRAAGAHVKAELLRDASDLVAGREARVRFTLRDAESGAPRAGLTGLRVLSVQPPGVWQQRAPAQPVVGRESEGVYEAQFTFPEEALYYFYFEVPSLGLSVNQVPFVTAEVAGLEASPAEGRRKER